MKEELPIIKLNLSGNEFQATPYNATLYTFLGRTVLETGDTIENASRNHVFLETGEPRVNENGEEVITGTYLFSPGTVQALGALMLEHGFPAVLNKRRIQMGDEAAYQIYINQQIEEVPDSFPEDWS